MSGLLLIYALLAAGLCDPLNEDTIESQQVSIAEFTGMKSDLKSMKDLMESLREENKVINEQVDNLLSQIGQLKAVLIRNDVDKKTLTNYFFSREGMPGPPGSVGPTGPAGPQGVAGRDGRDGSNGRDGREGSPGAPGAPGIDGKNGTRGDNGPAGAPGTTGGAVYTRWGRTTCGNNSTLIYQGFAGSSKWDETGGGVNYQCMVFDAEWDETGGGVNYQCMVFDAEWDETGGGVNYQCMVFDAEWDETGGGVNYQCMVFDAEWDETGGGVNYQCMVFDAEWDETGGGVNYQCMVFDVEYNKYTNSMSQFAHVSGTEFESDNYGVFKDAARRQNAPCAVCYANNRPSALMVPGKRTCPFSWHKEYEGYLMSERNTHPHPSTYECVDSDPEYVPGGARDDSGAIFYFNKPVCDKGVPCHSYVAERAITCVICTK